MREHSRKPDEFYGIVEVCSPGPKLELFARGERRRWTVCARNLRSAGAVEWVEAAE